MEVITIIVYDIEDTLIRNKIISACKDYGLVRFQYSAFMGKLNSNMRQQLSLRLKRLVENKKGRINLFPVCQKDLAQAFVYENPPISNLEKPEE